MFYFITSHLKDGCDNFTNTFVSGQLKIKVMTENETIEFVLQMDVFAKAKVYMNYFVNMLYSKYTSKYYEKYGIDKWKTKTYEEFCDKSNIQIKDTGCEDWKEKGFASKSWIVLRSASIYHYVYHSIN
jgi:hypothetical protein